MGDVALWVTLRLPILRHTRHSPAMSRICQWAPDAKVFWLPQGAGSAFSSEKNILSLPSLVLALCQAGDVVLGFLQIVEV